MPRSTATMVPSGSTKRLPGMHVGMEEAVAQRMAQEGLDQLRGDALEVVAGGAHGLDVRHLDAVDPLHRDDVAAGSLPVHPGHAETGIGWPCSRRVRKARPPPAAGPSRSWSSAPASRVTSTGCSRRAEGMKRSCMCAARKIAFEIVGEPPPHAGPDHLDGDLFDAPLPLDRRRDAPARSRRRRSARRSVHEQLVDRPAERFLDLRARQRGREGRHPVLQAGKIVGDVGADDVGPRREELAELDIGRPEPVDRIATCGRLRHRLARAAPREHARQLPCTARRADGSWSPRQRRDHAFARRIQPACGQAEIGCRRAHRAAGLTSSSPNAARRCRRYNCARCTRSKPASRIIAAKFAWLGNLRIDSTR